MTRVGTRGSKLALYQTNLVVDRLKAHIKDIAVHKITTGGDKNRTVPIASIGGTGVFVKELEDALINREVDFVVHSLKDMPTGNTPGLTTASVLDRVDPSDVLVTREKTDFKSLPSGAKVATSSRRRIAQLKALRSDLEYVDIRGNVPTRLKKMEDGQADAIILACAGLMRLELEDHIAYSFKDDECTPAAGQGALAVQCRADDEELIKKLSIIDDAEVREEITAERAFLEVLQGGCSTPIGVRAKYLPDYRNLTITGCVASLDGSRLVRQKLSSDDEDAQVLGLKLANLMMEGEAKEILEELRASKPNAISPP